MIIVTSHPCVAHGRSGDTRVTWRFLTIHAVMFTVIDCGAAIAPTRADADGLTCGAIFMFRVDSEVGRLRQVILHRPGLELKRLTPDNAADLLFDDVLWVSRAQQEHDSFADVLRSRGVVVHYYSDLLAQTLDVTAARDYVLDGVFDSRWHGLLAAEQLRAAVDGLDSPALAGYLVGGITKREISELAPEPKSIAFHSLDPDGFVLVPLPNLLYQRDTSCWIYGGVSINAMRRQARVRESLFAEAIYRWHPMFAGAGFDVWYHGADAAPATIEGGDVLVIGNGAVLAGMSERTTAQALEMLAHRLFAAGAATSLVAIDMPKQRAFMHLDTMLTMADYGVFTKYAGMGMLRSYTIEPGASVRELKVTDHPPEDMHTALAAALGLPSITVLTAVQDVRSAQREQWDDGCNVLAVAPGVVVAYERNVTTNAYLEENGIEVLTVAGGELGRGRGGPRCMSCPIERNG
jgi:arginine deiminase